MENNNIYQNIFDHYLDIMSDTFRKKNNDYGNSFFDSCTEEGIVAARVRLSDKWNRFKTLSKGTENQVKDESIADTLLDMANYCIMTLTWLNSTVKK